MTTGRIEKLVAESQSGPDLFINNDNAVITLGALHHLLCEVEYAVQAVQSVIDQLDHGYEDEAIPTMMGHLALGHAYDCLMEMRPCKDAGGREFWIEDDKITFATPQEQYAALMKSKAEKAQSKKGGDA